jgi:hypothetical protein
MSPQPQSPAEWVEALEAVGFFTTTETATTLHQWAAESDSHPLVIRGGEYDGKSTLADAVIGVLEGGPDARYTKAIQVPYRQHYSFEKLFYEWDGFIRQQAIKVTRELGRPPEEISECARDPKYIEEGLLLSALRSEHDPTYVLIEDYDGPSDDKTDKALAEFVTRHRIYVPELSGYESRPGGKRLRVIVILHSRTPPEQVAGGILYEALEQHGRWLAMEKPDRHHQFAVLGRMLPALPEQVVKELILFIELFGARPDVDYQVTFGEVIRLARSVQEYAPVERLSAELMRQLGMSFAKTSRSEEALERHADDVMREVRQTAF